MFYRSDPGRFLLMMVIMIAFVMGLTTVALAESKPVAPNERAKAGPSDSHRVITGVVEELTEDHAKVDAGEVGELNPRYLSLSIARDKGFSLKKGERVEIILNADNLVVDYQIIRN